MDHIPCSMTMKRTDVVVAGGGLLGLTSAWRLAQMGRRVTLVASPKRGASHAAAGMLAPSFEGLHHRAVPDLQPMLEASLALWPAFAAEVVSASGQSIDSHFDGICGIDIGTDLPGAQPCPVPPGFVATSAQFVKGEGQVDPRRLIAALRIILSANGVEHVAADVTALHEKGQIDCLLSDGNRLAAEQVLVATGATLPNMPPTDTIPVAVRGRSFRVRHSGIVEGVIRAEDVYFCPKADGTLYVGATEEEEGPSQEPIEVLWARACHILPSLKEAEILGVYDGLRPALPSGLPEIKRLGASGRIVRATGLDRNGVLLTPWCADQVSSVLSQSV